VSWDRQGTRLQASARGLPPCRPRLSAPRDAAPRTHVNWSGGSRRLKSPGRDTPT